MARDAAAINKKMPTGEVEIIAEDIRILSKAETCLLYTSRCV